MELKQLNEMIEKAKIKEKENLKIEIQKIVNIIRETNIDTEQFNKILEWIPCNNSETPANKKQYSLSNWKLYFEKNIQKFQLKEEQIKLIFDYVILIDNDLLHKETEEIYILRKTRTLIKEIELDKFEICYITIENWKLINPSPLPLSV